MIPPVYNCRLRAIVSFRFEIISSLFLIRASDKIILKYEHTTSDEIANLAIFKSSSLIFTCSLDDLTLSDNLPKISNSQLKSKGKCK